MITKEQILALLEGNLEIISEQLTEKAESVTADIVEQLGEAMLNEMTPGHKAMMKQHLDNITVVPGFEDEKGAETTPRKTVDGRIKNIKRPDDRDDYNEMGDFKSVKSKKSDFVAKEYTQNERQLRTDEAIFRDINDNITVTSKHPKKEIKKPDWKLKYRQPGESEETFKKRTVKEAMEPLMELSRGTLARYTHAAGHDQIRNYQKSDRLERDMHRSKDKNRLDWAQGKKDDRQKYADEVAIDHAYVDDDEKITKKIHNRTKGIGSALTRLAKEEVEYISEQNKYLAFYNGRKISIEAGSAYDAQKKAGKELKVPSSKRHMIAVKLAEKDGKPYTHSTSSI